MFVSPQSENTDFPGAHAATTVLPQDLELSLTSSANPSVPHPMCVLSYRMGGAESCPFWNYTEGFDQRWRQWALDDVYERRDDDRGLLGRIWETVL